MLTKTIYYFAHKVFSSWRYHNIKHEIQNIQSLILTRFGWHDKSDDQTVKTQYFGEDEDQDHTDEETWLLGSTTDTSITYNTDSETGSQTAKTDTKTCTKIDETPTKRSITVDD